MKQYKKILGFSSYEVSDDGIIINGKTKTKLKHSINKNNGIHSVKIKRDKNGLWTTVSVAKCIALAWIDNPNPNLYKYAIHINGNKDCLNIENIMWGTSCISTMRRDIRSPKHREVFLSHRVNINTRKMTDSMELEMIEYRRNGYSVSQLEDIFPIKKSQIRNILNSSNVTVDVGSSFNKTDR